MMQRGLRLVSPAADSGPRLPALTRERLPERTMKQPNPDMAPPSGGGGPSVGADVGQSWLTNTKVVAPSPPPGYFRRASPLLLANSVFERRITVLRAPAGFGKSSVLADLTATHRERGVSVAWLSVDEDDTPEVLGSYLDQAMQQAGVDCNGLGAKEAWAGCPFGHRFGRLARAIEAHAERCLLVLDAVERLPSRSVGVLDQLLGRSPPNLHLAVACRFNPGLDLMVFLLQGSAAVVDVESFRFSDREIAEFYGGALSRRELAEVVDRTAGWPVALMIDRHRRGGGEEGPAPPGSCPEYVGGHLLRGLSPEDGAALCDLAVFDRLRVDVMDEVLGSSDARLRIASLPALDGLLFPKPAEGGPIRLHPLLVEYCMNRLGSEDPARRRRLQARIAAALARAGDLRSVWRYAGSSGDGRLFGELVKETGVFGLWLREGGSAIAAASRAAPCEAIRTCPRVGLLRCVGLQLSGRFEKAAAMYESVEKETDGFTHEREEGEPDALAVDRAFSEVMLVGGANLVQDAALAGQSLSDDGLQPSLEHHHALAGARGFLRCVGLHEHARFDESRGWGQATRVLLTKKDMPYGAIFSSVYLGMTSMAQGRGQEAADCYHRARRDAAASFGGDADLAASLEVLSVELRLEQDRESVTQQQAPFPDLNAIGAVWPRLLTVAVSVGAELAFRRDPASDAAVRYLNRAAGVIRSSGTGDLLTEATALIVHYLSQAGRADEAELVWQDHGLPRETSCVLDLERQSWRKMEALSLARIALLAARGEAGAAGELADALWRTATKAGIVRTAARALGASMAAAWRAGDENRALLRLAALLRIGSRSGYYRGLTGQREVGLRLVRRLNDGPDAELRASARSAMPFLARPSSPDPEFSLRELQVLEEVRRGCPNKQIAALLGISAEGVRYHLKSIYRKAGVSTRTEAVRLAEACYLLG